MRRDIYKSIQARQSAGKQQAQTDSSCGYSDGLSKYRLRCAHAFRGNNPYAAAYMEEYDERGNHKNGK